MFTVEEANRTLPLVRVIVRDLALVSKRVVESGRRLEHLTEGRELTGGDPYADELAEMRKSLQQDSERVREFVSELVDLGIEPDERTAGVVDFPAEIDHERILLCWKFDEAEVLYWRRPGDAFDDRQPLTASSVPGDDLSDGSL